MDWTTGRSGFDLRQRWRIFPLLSASTPALGAYPASCMMCSGSLSPRIKLGRGVTPTTHSHVVPRSRMRVVGQLYFLQLSTKGKQSRQSHVVRFTACYRTAWVWKRKFVGKIIVKFLLLCNRMSLMTIARELWTTNDERYAIFVTYPYCPPAYCVVNKMFRSFRERKSMRFYVN
jgi:hypothetical protein